MKFPLRLPVCPHCGGKFSYRQVNKTKKQKEQVCPHCKTMYACSYDTKRLGFDCHFRGGNCCRSVYSAFCDPRHPYRNFVCDYFWYIDQHDSFVSADRPLSSDSA